ncbi:hypothetical protein F4801DRAFT_528788, partial [Xylaria longipes]
MMGFAGRWSWSWSGWWRVGGECNGAVFVCEFVRRQGKKERQAWIRCVVLWCLLCCQRAVRQRSRLLCTIDDLVALVALSSAL